MSGSISQRQRAAWQLGTALVAVVAAAVLLTNAPPLWGVVVGSQAEPARQAPCLPGNAVDIIDSPRIVPAQADLSAYHTVPPTSGPYFAFTVAPGVYDRAIPEGLSVSAMRRGHVVIQYSPDSVGPDELAELTRIAKRYGAHVVLAPYPRLAHGIAVTAWGRIDVMDAYDEPRIVAFVEALRGRHVNEWTTATDCS